MMPEARTEAPGGEHLDWTRWMRALGRQERRVREFLGISQEKLARLSSVSQGAISRLESGRGVAVPFLAVLKVPLVLVRALRAMDPALLTPELQRVLSIDAILSPPAGDIGVSLGSITKDPAAEELLRLYGRLAERRRRRFLSLVRAIVTALAGNGLEGPRVVR